MLEGEPKRSGPPQHRRPVRTSHSLLERWQVGVDGHAAQVVDEGQMFGYVSRGPVAEEAVQHALISTCREERYAFRGGDTKDMSH